MRTRKAVLKDLEAINELTLEMHNYLGALVGIEFSKEELRHEMYESENDLKNVYVAEFDGNVVGYIAFSERIHKNEFFGKYYHLYHIAVKRGFRRKGVASNLLHILLKKAKKENVNIVVGTFCLNRGGLKFYEKMGFKPIETVLVLDNTRKLKFHDK